MLIRECTPGRPVWARVGSYGWRPAVVERTSRGRSWHGDPPEPSVRVRFTSGRCGNGSRHPNSLRPRDPNAHGNDKPTPADAANILAAGEPC